MHPRGRRAMERAHASRVRFGPFARDVVLEQKPGQDFQVAFRLEGVLESGKARFVGFVMLVGVVHLDIGIFEASFRMDVAEVEVDGPFLETFIRTIPEVKSRFACSDEWFRLFS